MGLRDELAHAIYDLVKEGIEHKIALLQGAEVKTSTLKTNLQELQKKLASYKVISSHDVSMTADALGKYDGITESYQQDIALRFGEFFQFLRIIRKKILNSRETPDFKMICRVISVEAQVRQIAIDTFGIHMGFSDLGRGTFLDGLIHVVDNFKQRFYASAAKTAIISAGSRAQELSLSDEKHDIKEGSKDAKQEEEKGEEKDKKDDHQTIISMLFIPAGKPLATPQSFWQAHSQTPLPVLAKMFLGCDGADMSKEEAKLAKESLKWRPSVQCNITSVIEAILGLIKHRFSHKDIDEDLSLEQQLDRKLKTAYLALEDQRLDIPVLFNCLRRLHASVSDVHNDPDRINYLLKKKYCYFLTALDSKKPPFVEAIQSLSISSYIFTPKEMFFYDSDREVIIEIKINSKKLSALKRILGITENYTDQTPKTLSDAQLLHIALSSGHSLKADTVRYEIEKQLEFLNSQIQASQKQVLGTRLMPRVAFFAQQQESPLDVKNIFNSKIFFASFDEALNNWYIINDCRADINQKWLKLKSEKYEASGLSAVKVEIFMKLDDALREADSCIDGVLQEKIHSILTGQETVMQRQGDSVVAVTESAIEILSRHRNFPHLQTRWLRFGTESQKILERCMQDLGLNLELFQQLTEPYVGKDYVPLKDLIKESKKLESKKLKSKKLEKAEKKEDTESRPRTASYSRFEVDGSPAI